VERDRGDRNMASSLVALNRMAVINHMNRLLLFAAYLGVSYHACRIWILVYVYLFNSVVYSSKRG